MAIRVRRIGLLLLPMLLCQVSLQAQVSPRWSACRGDTLSTYNCASYYSGTFSTTSETKTADGTTTSSVVATLAAGRLTCRIKDSESGDDFEGAGMVAVQHEGTGDAGEYLIIIWCPETEGDRPSRHEPANLQSYKQRAADYATLVGKDSFTEADEANGVTQTVTTTWTFKRN